MSDLAQCPLLEIANGGVLLSGVSPEDIATFFCDTGFELVGADTLVCGDDGEWRPDPPVCRCKLSQR